MRNYQNLVQGGVIGNEHDNYTMYLYDLFSRPGFFNLQMKTSNINLIGSVQNKIQFKASELKITRGVSKFNELFKFFTSFSKLKFKDQSPVYVINIRNARVVNYFILGINDAGPFEEVEAAQIALQEKSDMVIYLRIGEKVKDKFLSFDRYPILNMINYFEDANFKNIFYYYVGKNEMADMIELFDPIMNAIENKI